MNRFLLCLVLSGPALAAAQTPESPPAASKAAATDASEVARKLASVKDPAVAIQAAAAFRARGDLAGEAEAWARAAQLRPHLGRYKLEAAIAYARQDKKRETYSLLLELQTHGYAYDLRGDERFAKVATTEVWEYILQGLDANRKPFGDGRVSHTLPREDLLLESVAWDAERKRLLVGSARDGRVYAVGAGDTLSTVVQADAENGMWAVFDIAVDAKRGVLWVASTAVPHYKGYEAERDLGRAGVFKFDLATGKFIKKFLSPSILGQSFFLSTLALGKDGEVYAADGVNNAVYQVRDDQFRRLFHAPTLSSIRGLSVSGDGKILYLADHERGVIGFDLAQGKPFDVLVPERLALGGIDGLTWWQGHLIVVQNGMEPTRIMRLKLDDAGRTIVGVQALAANIDALSLPTLGTLAGDRFHVIANSQKRNYDRFGLIKDASKLEGTRIYTVDAGWAPPKPAAAAAAAAPEPEPAAGAEPKPAD
jgi:hypothetical protein